MLAFSSQFFGPFPGQTELTVAFLGEQKPNRFHWITKSRRGNLNEYVLEYFFRKPRLRADGIMPITSHSLQNIVPFANGLGPRISAFFEYVEEHNILHYAAACERSLFSHYKKIYTRLNQLWRDPSSRRAGGCDLAPLLANLARRSSTHP